jgi:hypothetical protein
MLIYLIAAYAVLHVLDWGQTRTIALNPGKWSELNPILGPHPTLARVNIYFTLALVAFVALALLVPVDWGTGFALGCVIVEAFMVVRNHILGLRPTY